MSYIKIAVLDGEPVLNFYCDECGAKYTVAFDNEENIAVNWTNYPFCEVCESEIT